ncbi:MAG: hypothetical protein K0R84_2964 [Clostridia bacterium]|nr:hypothetical protein [Clostridia bacterium]
MSGITKTESTSITFYNPKELPFRVTGFAFFEKDKEYIRSEKERLSLFSETLANILSQTSGGMIGFKTNSTRLIIRADISSVSSFPQMALSGTGSFDIYQGCHKNKEYIGIAMPAKVGACRIDTVIMLREHEAEKEVTINFPLYSRVDNLEIGLDTGSIVLLPEDFSIKKPLVLYGSSITNGGCVSRPGNTYAAILGRWLDCPVNNFGFPGNAKGEPTVAEMISTIDMSAFVLDYDHNAPSEKHLELTYKPFYEIIRKSRPEIPIVMVSRPDFYHHLKSDLQRRDIIYKAYQAAFNNGDKNIYFVNGETLFGENDRDSCTVDGCHPNDLGSMRIAKGLYEVLHRIL